MPDRTGIFLGWSANLSNFLGLRVEAWTLPMYPQKMRVPPLGSYHVSNLNIFGRSVFEILAKILLGALGIWLKRYK